MKEIISEDKSEQSNEEKDFDANSKADTQEVNVNVDTDGNAEKESTLISRRLYEKQTGKF